MFLYLKDLVYVSRQFKIQVITNSRTAIVSSLTRYMQSIEAEKQKKHLQQEE